MLGSKKIYYLFALVLLLLAYLAGLWIPLTGDAGRYASIGSEMLRTGEYLLIKDMGQPYLEKPHFTFWMVAVFYKILGISDVVYKIPSFLHLLLMVFSIWKIGRHCFSEKVANIAALFAVSSLAFLFYSADVHMDVILAAWIAFAMWQFVLYLDTSKLIYIVGGFAGTALAMITKGPLGLFIIGVTIFFYTWAHGKWLNWWSYKLLPGIVVFVAILLPSLLGIYRQFGWEGLEFYFISNNTGRITGKLYNNSSDPFFYLHTLAWLVLPWTMPVVYGLLNKTYGLFRKKRFHKNMVFTIPVIWIYFLIISMSGFKAPNYLLVIMPHLFLITGSAIEKIDRVSRPGLNSIFVWVQYLIVILLWVMNGIMLLYIVESPTYLVVAMAALAAVNILMMVDQKQPSIQHFFPPSIIAIAALTITLNFSVLPTLYHYDSGRLAGNIIRSSGKGNNNVVGLDVGFNTALNFYSQSLVHYPDTAQFHGYINPGTWVFCSGEGLHVLKKNNLSFDYFRHFNYYSLSKPRPKFLNPKTRHEAMRDRYLIRVRD